MHGHRHSNHPPFAWAGARDQREDHEGRDEHGDQRGGRGGRGGFLAMSGRRGPGGRRFPFGPGGAAMFGGPGFGGPPFGGRGPRARRGDIRLAVLRLLAEQPMHGYQIIQELASRTGGMWNPSPGSVYPTLNALEDQSLVRAEEVEGRKVFHLTDAGRERLAQEASRPAPWDEVAAETGERSDLRDVTMGVLGAAHQVGSAGTPGQIERAVALLREARRRLYQVLAEDPEAPEAPTAPTEG